MKSRLRRMGPINEVWSFQRRPCRALAVSRSPPTRRFAACCLLTPARHRSLDAQSLFGSRESLLRQNDEAREHDFTYLRTSADVRDYAQQRLLVRLPGNSDYELESDEVSFPYARPEVKLVRRAARGPVPQRLRREAGGHQPDPADHAPARQRLGDLGPPHRHGGRPAAKPQLRLPELARDHAAGPREQGGAGGDPGAVSAALPRGGLPEPVPAVRRLGRALPRRPGRQVDLEVDTPAPARPSRSSRGARARPSPPSGRAASRVVIASTEQAPRVRQGEQASARGPARRGHRSSHGKSRRAAATAVWTIAQAPGRERRAIKQANRSSDRRHSSRGRLALDPP